MEFSRHIASTTLILFISVRFPTLAPRSPLRGFTWGLPNGRGFRIPHACRYAASHGAYNIDAATPLFFSLRGFAED